MPGSKAGINTSDSFTAENAIRDWLTKGTEGLSDKTISDYESLGDSNLIPFIGAHKLKALTAHNKSKHWCRVGSTFYTPCTPCTPWAAPRFLDR